MTAATIGVAFGRLDRPLTIDVREPVTVFYQAEEKYCMTIHK